MSVYIVGEAGKNTTDIETFSDQIESKKNDQKWPKMTKQDKILDWHYHTTWNLRSCFLLFSWEPMTES